MQKRPSIKALILESHRFAWGNRDWAFYYLVPLIIPILVFSALSQLGSYFYDILGVFELGAMYLYACFALSWHRAFLMGPRSGHRVSPLHLKPGEGKFILAVSALGVAPILLALVLFIPFALAGGIGGEAGLLIGALFAVPVLIYGGIKIARCFFILPAKSMNVAISLKEADRISRGLLLPFLVTSMMFVTLFLIVTGIPAGLIMLQEILAAIHAESDDIESTVAEMFSFRTSLMMFIFVTLPSIPLWLYTIALNVGILSRLYQWAVQERG
jgi:hypothetical protein